MKPLDLKMIFESMQLIVHIACALFIAQDSVSRQFLLRDPRDSPTKLQNTRETRIRSHKNTLLSIWRDTERSEYHVMTDRESRGKP